MTSKVLSGGDKLRARLDEIAANLEKGGSVRVGFLENAKYPDGKPVAMVAAIQEFGAPAVGIPPRSFFRTMITAKSGEWGEQLAADLKTTDYDSAKALGYMGEDITGELRQSIIDIVSPPLSPVTLMLRSLYPKNSEGVKYRRQVVEARMLVELGEQPGPVSTKPLEWTHHMIDSVGFEVKS